MPEAWRKAADWIFVNALAAAACSVGALLGTALQFGTTSPVQNWPLVGIGLVVAHVLGYRCFPGVWLVCVFTVGLALMEPGTQLSPLLLQLLISAILAGQIFLAASLLRIPEGQNPLLTQRGVLMLLVSGLIAALAGNSLRFLVGWLLGFSHLEVFTRFAYRVSKFVSGVLLVSPLVFMLHYERRPRLSRSTWAEILVILAVLSSSTLLASTNIIPFFQTYQQMMILLILPLTLWVTLRAEGWGGPISVFVASLISVWGTLRGWNAFGVPASTTAEILMHLYLVTVAITTLTVGAVLKERSTAYEEVREAKSDLEAKVRSRTVEVRRERDFGSAIFDHLGALVLVMKKDGTIDRINKTFQDFTGKSSEEVRGKNIWDLGLIPEEEQEVVKKRLVSAGVGENHLIASDGTKRLFEWTHTWLEPQNTEQSGFLVAVGIDVTDRRRAQEEALEAIKARDLFLSVASHELRTPLTTLQLQLQSLQRFIERRADLPSEIRTRLHSALRQTRRLGDLINELLDVSRITYGRLIPERTETNLASIVREVIERYRVALEQSGSELVVHGLDEEVIGFWDPLRVDQIVDNLLSNAIKYGEGRPIEIEIERVDFRARIVVRDQGIGISSKDQERIFGRFERAVSTRYYGGFGLGLWITRQVVEAHEGTIEVESKLGKGSTFIVELPLCTPETSS